MMASERMTLVEAVEYIRNNEAHDAALAELQEVRECLDECIAAFPKTAEGEQRARAAQRARQLAERLRVR